MWTDQQSSAIHAVMTWVRDPKAKQVFRLFGFAGTGKSTLAREIARLTNGVVLFAAFTGKAALVMRSKGCANACTIHALIYKVEEQLDGTVLFKLNPSSAVLAAKLVIIDECSMVSDELARDLLSFGTKVLVLGDPAQLPPVKGTGYFTEAVPDIMLTEIHRQAADNPIIRMSMDVREGKRLCVGAYGDSKIITGRPDPEEVLAADQVLVGTNRTRRSCNMRIRQLKCFPGTVPRRSERLVCLRNNREKGLLNGGLWTVDSPGDESKIVRMDVKSEDDTTITKPVPVEVPLEFFLGEEAALPYPYRRKYDEFDFGYALTVHKSQGSQWQNLMLFDESGVFRDISARHLYTAITRAADRITIVL